MTAEEKKDFILDMVAKDQAEGYCEVPITRFPPEPNGYLHIGHAKAICLDFGLAKEYAHLGAVCHLRFDDTNPCKEDIEFVNSIQEDIHWLGFDWGEHLYWASNIFDFYYDCAVALIKKGLAYVDLQDRETMRQHPVFNRSVGIPARAVGVHTWHQHKAFHFAHISSSKNTISQKHAQIR